MVMTLSQLIPQPYGDNPSVYSPAGTVHCSLEDWAKFAIFHLTGEPEGFLSVSKYEKPPSTI